jgi:hypothetical protein
MALDRGGRVDDGQLVPVRSYLKRIPGNDRNLGEKCAGRFPAFAATASVIVGAIARDGHFNPVAAAFAIELAAAEVWPARTNAVIHGRMNGNTHLFSSQYRSEDTKHRFLLLFAGSLHFTT